MNLLQQYQLLRPQTQLFKHSRFPRCDFCRGFGIFHSKIALARGKGMNETGDLFEFLEHKVGIFGTGALMCWPI